MITFFAKIFVNRHDKISFDILMEIIKRKKIKSSRIKNGVQSLAETLEKRIIGCLGSFTVRDRFMHIEKTIDNLHIFAWGSFC